MAASASPNDGRARGQFRAAEAVTLCSTLEVTKPAVPGQEVGRAVPEDHVAHPTD